MKMSEHMKYTKLLFIFLLMPLLHGCSIDAGHGAAKSEIPVAVARMLGFRVTTGQLRSIIESQIAKMIRNETIVESNGLFHRKKP